MIFPVVVAVNRLRPLTHALTPGDSWGTATSAAVSGFFVVPTSSVPHTLTSTYMGGVGENIGQRYTPLITLADCVRGTVKDRGTW
jgi:hypothetical protein